MRVSLPSRAPSCARLRLHENGNVAASARKPAGDAHNLTPDVDHCETFAAYDGVLESDRRTGPSLHGRRQRLSMEIPSVALNSWALGRLDVVGIFQGGGSSGQVFHKAWNGSSWDPSEPDLWDRLGGFLDRPLAIVSWAANRLDIFGLSNNLANPSMLHKAWDGQEWLPSHADWERLGGTFAQPPTVASWAHDRLDIFGVGTDGSMMLHKAWDGQRWLPSPVDWEALGA